MLNGGGGGGAVHYVKKPINADLYVKKTNNPLDEPSPTHKGSTLRDLKLRDFRE
jgi:hypothetical protein